CENNSALARYILPANREKSYRITRCYCRPRLCTATELYCYPYILYPNYFPVPRVSIHPFTIDKQK
ncbi:MAG: hypothetical protein KAJ00_10120, partial [Deltaproteobacteria bacterium]|nr:hypothetical protein [Deltaproteobacteria bacterium]